MKKNDSNFSIEYNILFLSQFSIGVVINSIPVTVISFFLLVLLSPSLFAFGADPGMTPSPSQPSPPPPAATTGEKAGIMPIIPPPPPPPTASKAIDKLLGVLPKTPPIVEEKIDPKDGNIILSSKTDDGTTTIATKVEKNLGKKSLNWNRGYIDAIKVFFDPEKIKFMKSQSFPKNMKEYLSDPQFKNPSDHFKFLVAKYGKEYIQGIYEGFRDALILDDMFGIIATKSSK